MRRHLSLPLLAGLAVLVIVLGLPLITSDAYFIQVASLMGIAVILAVSLGLLYGYTGQMSFAHAGFYGIGAYTAVDLHTKTGVPFLISLVAAMVVAGAVAFVVGIPTLRLHGHYLAIGTLALQMGINEFFIQASPLTGGTVGIFGIERPTFLGISLQGDAAYYELIAVVAVLTFLLAERLVNSRFGRGLIAVREDETAATVIGINPSRYKVEIFAVSAALAALAGALYAYQILFVSPVTFSLDWSITILSMVVIGGVGSNVGAALGAVAVTVIQQMLFSLGDLQFLVYGILIVVVLVFFPGGVAGIGRMLLGLRDTRIEAELGKVEPSPAVPPVEAQEQEVVSEQERKASGW